VQPCSGWFQCGLGRHIEMKNDDEEAKLGFSAQLKK